MTRIHFREIIAHAIILTAMLAVALLTSPYANAQFEFRDGPEAITLKMSEELQSDVEPFSEYEAQVPEVFQFISQSATTGQDAGTQSIQDAFTVPQLTPQQPSLQQPLTPQTIAPRSVAPPQERSFNRGSGVGFASGSRRNLAAVGGYIDPARIASRVRVRYDDMQGNNAPTRAEFLYPTIGGFGGPGPADPGFPDSTQQEIGIRELSTYVEWAIVPRLSIFTSLPIRWLNPLDLTTQTGFGPNDTTPPVFDGQTQTGAGDVSAGFRVGIIDWEDEWLTGQLTFVAPTGNARQALGVGHSSIDVALLYQRQWSDRLTFMAEIHDWQTTSGFVMAGTGTQYDGQFVQANVLRVGAGAGYDMWQNPDKQKRLTAVFECAGWTVLEGLETAALRFTLDGTNEIRDAAGDTIVNGKYGVRYTTGANSVYVGYGHNWTSDRWYSDLFRLELTHAF